jgi:hypothetical protein
VYTGILTLVASTNDWWNPILSTDIPPSHILIHIRIPSHSLERQVTLVADYRD